MAEGLIAIQALLALGALALAVAFIIGFFMIVFDVRKMRDMLSSIEYFAKTKAARDSEPHKPQA